MMTTRTRPKTLSASRRKRRPELESLEEKKLLTTFFGAYPDGTWAFNQSAGWRHLNEADPVAMKEGEAGTLFVSYNNGPFEGTWRYDYGPNTWTELTGAVASVLSASQTDNTMFATFPGQGTWELDASWHQMASHDATMLAGVADGDVYAVFTGDKSGTWHSKGGWNEITSAVPTVMDASTDGAMYASYSDGTWEYFGSSNVFFNGWERQCATAATQIAAISNSEFFMSLAVEETPSESPVGQEWDPGTYEVFGGTFSGVFPFPEGFRFMQTSDVPTHMSHSGNTMIGSFSNGTSTEEFDNGNLSHIDNGDGPVDDFAFMFG
jgi:hypothetical protein